MSLSDIDLRFILASLNHLGSIPIPFFLISFLLNIKINYSCLEHLKDWRYKQSDIYIYILCIYYTHVNIYTHICTHTYYALCMYWSATPYTHIKLYCGAIRSAVAKFNLWLCTLGLLITQDAPLQCLLWLEYYIIFFREKKEVSKPLDVLIAEVSFTLN